MLKIHSRSLIQSMTVSVAVLHYSVSDRYCRFRTGSSVSEWLCSILSGKVRMFPVMAAEILTPINSEFLQSANSASKEFGNKNRAGRIHCERLTSAIIFAGD